MMVGLPARNVVLDFCEAKAMRCCVDSFSKERNPGSAHTCYTRRSHSSTQ